MGFQQPAQDIHGTWVGYQPNAFQMTALVYPAPAPYPRSGVGATGDPLNLRKDRTR